jgi:hypothetical protein
VLEIFRLSVDKNYRQKGTAAKLMDRINQVKQTSNGKGTVSLDDFNLWFLSFKECTKSPDSLSKIVPNVASIHRVIRS